MRFFSTAGLIFSERFNARGVQKIKKAESVEYISHMFITEEEEGMGAILSIMVKKSKDKGK